MISRLHTTLLLLLVGCGDNIPAEPTWQDHVAPILVANCARCHGAPALGGAPDGFRLDVWQDTVTGDGRRILGAGAMAEFVAARADSNGMPPRLELRERQRETLLRWLAIREDGRNVLAPPGPVAPDNKPPTIRFLTTPQPPISDAAETFRYEVEDPEGDIVTGELFLRSNERDLLVARGLKNGRHSVSFDASVVAAGNYILVAVLQDHPFRAVEYEISSLRVSNADDNVAPIVRFASPLTAGSLLTDADSPFTIAVFIEDPDESDAFELTLEAHRGERRISIAEAIPAVAGFNGVTWDLDEVPAGVGWTLTAMVSDGTVTRTANVTGIAITHASTNLRWEDVAPVFEARCGGCHRGADSRIPGLSQDFRDYDTNADGNGVFDARGQIYWRAVLQRTMPPPSARLLLDDSEQMTEEERLAIAEWLEAGAPR